MIIYNITFKVDWSIHDDWLSWLIDIHIPGMLDTGLFYKHQLVRLLDVEESDGPTYAVQYYLLTLRSYHDFMQHQLALKRREAREKWGDKFVEFSTLMEVVHNGE